MCVRIKYNKEAIVEYRLPLLEINTTTCIQIQSHAVYITYFTNIFGESLILITLFPTLAEFWKKENSEFKPGNLRLKKMTLAFCSSRGVGKHSHSRIYKCVRVHVWTSFLREVNAEHNTTIKKSTFR